MYSVFITWYAASDRILSICYDCRKNLETKIFINAKTQILQDVWSRRVVYEVFFLKWVGKNCCVIYCNEYWDLRFCRKISSECVDLWKFVCDYFLFWTTHLDCAHFIIKVRNVPIYNISVQYFIVSDYMYIYIMNLYF